MMHDISAEQSHRPMRGNRFRFLGLAIGLSLLAGCASTGKVKPAPEPPAPAASAEPVPAVSRLTDGREGFVIRESSDLDAQDRQRFDQAVALMQSGEYARAAALLEPVVEAAPEVTAPYIDLALAYQQLGRTEEAGETLQVALRLFPGHPVAANAYGLLLRRQGRFSEAREVYEKSLARFPEYLPARKNLGILCDLYLDDAACALEQYETYFTAMPQDEEVGIWIAGLRLRLGTGG